METRRSWPDVWGTAAWDGCQLREESRVPQGGSGVKVQVVTGTALSFPLVPGGKSLKAPSLGPCLVRVTASVTLAGHRPRAKAEDAGMTIPAECWVRTTHRHLRPSQSHPVPQPRGPRSGGDGASTTNSSRDGASSPQTPPCPPPHVSLAFPAGPPATMGRGSSSLRQPPPGGPRAGPVLCPGRGSSSEHPVRTPCGFIPGCRAQWGVLQDDARRRGAAGPVGLSRGRSGFSSRCRASLGHVGRPLEFRPLHGVSAPGAGAAVSLRGLCPRETVSLPWALARATRVPLPPSGSPRPPASCPGDPGGRGLLRHPQRETSAFRPWWFGLN